MISARENIVTMICADTLFIHKPTKIFFASALLFLLIGVVEGATFWSSAIVYLLVTCTILSHFFGAFRCILARQLSVCIQKVIDFFENKSDCRNTSFKSPKTGYPVRSIMSDFYLFLHFPKPTINVQFAVVSVLILIQFAFTGNINAQTQTFNANGTFTVPAGVSSVTVQAWGSGGAGGGSTSNKNGGSGGGGGGYTTASLGVTSGQSIIVTVGAGGTGSTGNGTNGTATSFLALTANGGTGGVINQGNVGVGGTASGGSTNISGSNGIVGTQSIGGNGGAGANGGAGGNGGTASNGGNGTSPGGGGGGGESGKNTDRAGGNGAAGRVIVTWTCPLNAGTLSGVQTICMGGSSTFSSDVLGGVWSSGNSGIATIGSSTGVITTISTGTATMTYTITPAGCTTQTATRTVTVNPSSVGGTLGGGTSPLCLGSATGTMTLIGYTGTIVQWERQVNSGGWSNINNGGNATLSEIPWSSGVWQYRVAVQNGSCSLAYSSIVSITVNPTTVGGWISGSSTPICLGSNTGAFTLNGSTGSVVRWERRLNSGVWENVANTLVTYSEVPSSGGTWEYRALLQSGSCFSSYSSSFSMTVNPTLTIALGTNPVICRGTTSALLPYSATTGSPSAYSISFDTAAKTAGMSDVSGAGLTASPIQINVPWNIVAGVYNGTLSVATTYPVCSSIGYPITITVQNNVIAQPSTITGSAMPCQNSSQIYSITNVAGVTYTWTFPAGWTQTAGGTTNSVTVTVGAGSGNVQVTPSNACGNGPVRTLAVTPSLVPAQPGVITGSLTPCQNSSQIYSVINVAGVTYTWAFPAGWIQTAGGTANSVTVTVGTGSGNVQVTPSNACGNGTAQTLAVTPTTVPIQPGTITGSATPCQTSSQIYSVTNVAGVTYTWTFPAGWTQTAGGTTNSVTVTIGAGSGNVQVTPSNTCGNGTIRTLAVTPTLVPAQPGIITGSTTPCQTSSQIYSVTNVAGVTYNWTFPAGWTQTAGGTTNSITVTVGAGSGNVQVTPSNACGNGTARTLSVTTGLTISSPATTGALICIGSTATLSASGAIAGNKYNWYDAATSGTLLKTSLDNTDNTYITPVLPATTNYWVSILSSGGCESSRTQVTATYPNNSTDDQNVAGTNSWIGHVYDGLNLDTYIGHYTELELFDESFGGDYTCFNVISNSITRSIYTETFSVRYRMNSTKKGLYVVDMGADDGIRLTVDGTILFNNWVDQAYTSRPLVLMNLTGASSLAYDYYENGGGNRVLFQNLTSVLSNAITTNTSQSIYVGSTGLALSGDGFGTLPTGITLNGTGYQWTYSTTPLGVRTNISGATGAAYTPNASIAPFNVPGTFYIYRNATLNSANNVNPNPYIATNESNASTLIINNPPVITVSPATLTGFSYTVGSGPSAQQSFTVGGTYLTANITVTPSTNFEISTTSGSGFVATPITLTQAGGTVATTTIYVRLKTGLAVGTYAAENLASTSTGATTQNVACSGTVVNIPLITASTTTLTGFTYNVGSGPSIQQSFTVGGTYLTANIIVNPSTNYEISTTSGSGFQLTPITLTQVAGTVATTTIYVRLKAGLAVGNYAAENIASVSTGAVTKNVACSGTVVIAPLVTVSPATLTGFSYTVGSGPSAQQSFTVGGTNLSANIIVNPSTNYEISTTSGSGFQLTPITLTQVAGTIATTTIYVRLKAGLAIGNYAAENIASTSTGAVTKNVACSGTVVNIPLITTSIASLSGFSYVSGSGPSTQQSFTVSGNYLTANLTVTPPTDFEISLTSGVSFVAANPISITPTSGTVTATTIYVRLKAGLAIGTYAAENIAMTSTNAITKNVACSGTVTNIPVITISPTILTEFSYIIGAGPSSQQSFTVGGVNLIGNITVIPPTDYEISLTSGVSFVATNPISFTPTSGTVATTTIYVRLKGGLPGGIYAGENIALTSTSATTQNVACSGVVNAYVQIWKGGTLQTSFSTLKAAFDAINAGTYTGILDIKINGSIVDNTTATLYQSGYTNAGNTSNYSSVKIYPTVAGITLSGSVAAPLIDLNGADNVTIDGSVNALGSTKSLIISNTSISPIAGTSTIRFINSAENNSVTYCNIKGSETNAASGVISFSTSSAGNGNDKNTIDNNDITSSAAGRPINAIYSLGSASFENSGNIILNNNIFDFWNASNSSSAIQLGSNTTDFTISLNSFYETTSFLPTGAFNYKMIWIFNPTGNNFVVSTNYIGGSTSLCGGAALLLGTAGNVDITLDPIEINAGTTAASSVQGNIIKNINLRSSNVAPFRAINVVAGTLNIGTEAGNTIGSSTGIGSVTVTSTITTGNVYGIYIASGNTVDCQNNNIGSITAANSNVNNATNLYGIYKTATAGTTTISRNIIGSIATANSLNTSSTAIANSQLLYGIYSAGTGNTTISTNTIANITNNTTETTLASRLRGILTEGGSNDINNNEVHHLLSRGAANGANYPNTSLIGISQVSKLAGSSQNVNGNSVYNLTNTAIVKMEMYGIYYDGPPTGTNTISRNFVHSYYISSTDAAYLHGISLYGGAFTASNNIVYLGNTITTGCSMWAMWTNSTNSIRIYHNTLYLGGIAASGASNTYAFRSLNAGPTDAIIKNNILWNNRTNSSNIISHYAIFLQSSANTSVDYNDFRFYQQFGIVGTTPYASFATWKAGTSFDTNSTEADPLLINLGGTLPTDYQTSVPLDGVPGTGILTDYNSIVRSTIAPTMGAWEYFSNPVEVWNGTTFRKGYNTLKGAFDKINDGTWTGDLIIKFKGNTIETAPAVLNASGTGLSNYTKILIYPSRLGVTVTGSLAAPMVDLNGCDNITFDGRKDASGTASEITFSNTSTSNVAGTSTFRFINDANNNTIKNCTIKGSSTDAGAGVIFFSTTTGTTGNDGNTIDNNSITNAADANRPLNIIYSSGTSAKENSGNTISNNNIYNFLNRGTASNGFYLGSFTSGETIQGNSFYETAPFTPTASVSYNIINISNPTGVNYSISGNFIGGSSALCGGTAWTKLANPDNIFTAINLSAGTGTASNIQNNTIQKIAWSNSGAAAWTGINIAAGDVNVGTITANTIGAATGTGSVTVTNATTGANVYGINIASSGTVDCQNNIIASITTANAAANATNFYGINKTPTAGTTTISNNTIGNTATANSINTSSTSTGNAQSLYGIYNAGTGAITLSNNVLVNLSNSTNNATGATSGLINGIFSSGGTNTISNNTIRNLIIANANAAATSSAAVGGIVLTGSTSARTISGNTVYNLSNTYAAFAGRVVGIYYEGSTSGTNIVSKNFIYSLSTSGTSGASLFGIWIVSGVTTYSNNIVNLGSANQNLIYGIYDTGAASQTCNFYFNTIYIGGVVAAGTYNSYAFYNAAATNTRNYRNNILSNARSNTAATGTHFAIYLAASGGTLVINYNDYYAPGTGGVLGYYNAANRTTLALWQAATAQDAYSLNNNPAFVNGGSTIASDYKIAQSLIGIAGTGITIDYGSVPRGTPPTMGVWEANINKWKGSTSIDWNTASNWTANIVPAVDATIIFDDIPVRHCQLDKDRSVTNIINAQGVYRMVTNGHKLTVKGDFNFTNGAQVDASSTNSIIELAGSWSQTIPAGIFYKNEVYDLTINNSNNVTLYGTMRLLHLIAANAGRLDANITTPTFVYAGSSAQTIESNRFFGDNIYNLSIDNLAGVALANTVAITVPHDLTITKGVLTIPPGALLTVDNFTKLDYRAPLPVPYPLLVDYWSCLVLKSNATSTGSFIHTDLFTGIGTVKVERFMSHTNNWHLCSSPIKDQSMKDFLKYNPEIPDLFDITVTPNVLIGVGIRDYLTPTDVWSPYFIYANVSTTAGTVGKGKGFNIRTYNDVQGTGTVDATGIPNPNTVNVALTRSALPTDKGWNCIGNPFTSAINIKDGTSAGFLNATNVSNLDPAFVAVYVWDTNNITTSRTTPEYIVLNNATSITSVQISQGFFVKSKAGGGNVTFTKAMQSPNSALTFKAATVEWPSIKIVATNQVLALSSSTEIKFIPNTTKGLDLGYDAGIFKANPHFSLFSKLVEDNAIDFTLQCLPDQDYDQYVIPIGFDCKVGGELTFTAESINLPSGCQAVLEDRLTKRFTRLDLDGAKYTVLLSPDTKGTGRFFLHTTDVISSDQPLEKQPFKVYTIGKSVYINGEVSDDAQFYLYSVIGKQLANFKAESQVQNRLDASGFPSGVYLLTIIDKKQKKTIKFLLGN